jgi:hypothetical protein
MGEIMKETKPAVTEEEIRSRAYEIYVERGSGDSRALEDWVQAKAELEKSPGKARPRSKDNSEEK